MTTYMVFTRTKTTDQTELDVYTREAGPSLEGHPVTPLAAYGRQEILEGPSHEGTVIVSFPTWDAALKWYNSPKYSEARKHRFRGAEYQVTLVEGLS